MGGYVGSLTSNEDRLAFSVVWHMDGDGNVLDQWIGRGVIRSCAQLSYHHAQAVIEVGKLRQCSSGNRFLLA